MSSWSELRVGPICLESASNYAAPTRQPLFQAKHAAVRVQEYDDGERIERIIYQAPLGELITRLELCGATMHSIEQLFNPRHAPYYSDPHDIPFCDVLTLLRSTDLEGQGRADGGMLPAEVSEILQGLYYSPEPRIPGWDVSALIDRLPLYHALRLLAERPQNHSLMVVWDYMDLVVGGYRDASEFTVGADSRFLLVTEGTSDTNIIRHAFNILRPDVADFFRYADMETNYPFGGHGNLLNFMRGLHSIGLSKRVLAIFDNDTAGVGSLQQLCRTTDVRAIKLPDLEAFERFPTVGPSGFRH